MGRGLACVEHRSENMLLNMYSSLDESKNSSLKRAAILKVKEDSKSHLSQVVGYLRTKYHLEALVRPKVLCKTQSLSLYNEIKNLHNY